MKIKQFLAASAFIVFWPDPTTGKRIQQMQKSTFTSTWSIWNGEWQFHRIRSNHKI